MLPTAGSINDRTKQSNFTDLTCKLRTRTYQPKDE
jgi:hypothetical protein